MSQPENELLSSEDMLIALASVAESLYGDLTSEEFQNVQSKLGELAFVLRQRDRQIQAVDAELCDDDIENHLKALDLQISEFAQLVQDFPSDNDNESHDHVVDDSMTATNCENNNIDSVSTEDNIEMMD